MSSLPVWTFCWIGSLSTYILTSSKHAANLRLQWRRISLRWEFHLRLCKIINGFTNYVFIKFISSWFQEWCRYFLAGVEIDVLGYCFDSRHFLSFDDTSNTACRKASSRRRSLTEIFCWNLCSFTCFVLYKSMHISHTFRSLTMKGSRIKFVVYWQPCKNYRKDWNRHKNVTTSPFCLLADVFTLASIESGAEISLKTTCCLVK
jgi:hypothetical protein